MHHTLFKILHITVLGYIWYAPFAPAQNTTSHVQWHVSLWGQKRAFTEHVEKLATLIQQKSQGTFTLKLQYGEILSKARENLDGIAFGAFEMAQTCMVYHPDKIPTLSVTALPGVVKNTDLPHISAIYHRIHQHPQIKKEFANWHAKILMPTPVPASNLIGTGKAPTTLQHFKGMRVRTGGPMADIIRQLGGNAMMFSASETYTALDTKVVDAVAFPPHAHLAFDTINLGDWRTENLGFITGDCPIIINQDAYDALSPAHQQILTTSVPEALTHYFKTYATYTQQFLHASKHMQVITYTEDDQAEIKKLTQRIRQQWVADMQKKGIDGQHILDTITK